MAKPIRVSAKRLARLFDTQQLGFDRPHLDERDLRTAHADDQCGGPHADQMPEQFLDPLGIGGPRRFEVVQNQQRRVGFQAGQNRPQRIGRLSTPQPDRDQLGERFNRFGPVAAHKDSPVAESPLNRFGMRPGQRHRALANPRMPENGHGRRRISGDSCDEFRNLRVTPHNHGRARGQDRRPQRPHGQTPRELADDFQNLGGIGVNQFDSRAQLCGRFPDQLLQIVIELIDASRQRFDELLPGGRVVVKEARRTFQLVVDCQLQIAGLAKLALQPAEEDAFEEDRITGSQIGIQLRLLVHDLLSEPPTFLSGLQERFPDFLRFAPRFAIHHEINAQHGRRRESQADRLRVQPQRSCSNGCPHDRGRLLHRRPDFPQQTRNR